MGLTTFGQAVGMFVATNVDDLVVLAVFFGRARGHRSATVGVFVGQCLGFAAILAVSVAAALGARSLPESALAYLGLIPLLLGLVAAWTAFRRHRAGTDDGVDGHVGASVLTVAAVTFANGGDNLGVYVPVFAIAGPSGIPAYVAIFSIGIAVWCVLAWYVCNRPAVAIRLTRWNHVLMPAVLIAIGIALLVAGGAPGLH